MKKEYQEKIEQVMKSRNEELAKVKEGKNDHTWKNYVNMKKIVTRLSGLQIAYGFSSIAAIFIVGVFVFTTYRLPPVSDSLHDGFSHYGKDKVLFENANEDNMAAYKSLEETDVNQTLAMLEKTETDIKFKMMLLERDLDTREETLESINEKLNKLYEELQHLQWEKVQALIVLKRHEEAMRLLDEIRQSESKHKEQADSLYHLLQK